MIRFVTAITVALWYPTIAASAAVVVVSFSSSVGFHSGGDNDERRLTPLPVGLDGVNISLEQGGVEAYLVSQWPVRVGIVASQPPNIGGLVKSFEEGQLIGAAAETGVSWWQGEAAGSSPDNNYVCLYSHLLVGPMVTDFDAPRSFIGIEFVSDGQVHYGWLEVEVRPEDVPTPGYEVLASRIVAFGYETEAGKPIRAGLVPEPSFAAMAAGAALLMLRRTSRIQPATGSRGAGRFSTTN